MLSDRLARAEAEPGLSMLQILIGKETSRQLGMGTNILGPQKLPRFEVGGDVPNDLGKLYGKMCYEADGFAQVCSQCSETTQLGKYSRW